MKSRSWYLVVPAVSVLLAGCANLTVTDRNALTQNQPAVVERTILAKTLVVPRLVLPNDQPEHDDSTAEAKAVLLHSLARLKLPNMVVAEFSMGASDHSLLQAAHEAGLDTVTVIRVEGYQRRAEMSVGFAIPPISWKTETGVSITLRVLDVMSGKVVADIRRDRVFARSFAIGQDEDLPPELETLLETMISDSGEAI